MSSYSCYLCQAKNLTLVVKLNWPLYRCPNCGLVQVSPLPSKQAVAALYQGDYWKNYGYYQSQIPAHRRYFRYQINRIKKYRPAGKLLDLGCAVGIFLDEAKKQGYTVEGVDISDYAVDQCRRIKVPAVVGDIFSINKKNYYDIITAFEVVEHDLNPLPMLGYAHQLLKTNGLLVVTVPNTDSWSRRLMGKWWFGYRNKEHLFHFNQRSLNLLLKKTGFKKIKIMRDINRPYQLIYFLERLNYYLFNLSLIRRLTDYLKKFPVISRLTINLNPWDNLIAFAEK